MGLNSSAARAGTADASAMNRRVRFMCGSSRKDIGSGTSVAAGAEHRGERLQDLLLVGGRRRLLRVLDRRDLRARGAELLLQIVDLLAVRRGLRLRRLGPRHLAIELRLGDGGELLRG